MNDAENLSKLLSHLPPAAFHEFMHREFAVALAPLDPKQGKREQRAGMAAALSALTVGKRQRIEEVAERLVLLSDGAGQDVIEGLREDICGEAARDAFAAIPNQYERALWLHTHEPLLFDEALSARQADVFRQSAACYSGFTAPAGLRVADDEASRAAFHQAVAQQLGDSAGQTGGLAGFGAAGGAEDDFDQGHHPGHGRDFSPFARGLDFFAGVEESLSSS